MHSTRCKSLFSRENRGFIEVLPSPLRGSQVPTEVWLCSVSGRRYGHSQSPQVSQPCFRSRKIDVVRKIEDYIDPRFDIIFYDRFYNQEVVAGAFLLKNSAYTREFLEGLNLIWKENEVLTGFSNYLYKLPDAFHGTDNGALHVGSSFDYWATTVYRLTSSRSSSPTDQKTIKSV